VSGISNRASAGNPVASATVTVVAVVSMAVARVDSSPPAPPVRFSTSKKKDVAEF